MLPTINNYTLPDLSGIVNGQPNDATDVTNIFTSSDQVNDSLSRLTNNVTRTITSSTSITQNQDVNSFVNSTGGAFTITLPALSGSYKAYRFKKISNDYNKITLQTVGADKIDNPFQPQAVPVNSSIQMTIPGDDFTIVSDGSYWRVLANENCRVSFNAYRVGNYTTSTSWQKAPYNLENYDIGGYYNTGTYAHNPKIEGYYTYTHTVRFDGSNTTYCNVALYKNVSQIANTIQSADNASFSVQAQSVTYTVYMNGTTDFVEFFYRTSNATKTFNAFESFGEGKLVHRLG